MQRYSSLAMLKRLVGFDTVSHRSNLELIHFVRDYLAGWGIPSQLIAGEDGSKANLYATIGPADQGGVMLAGHTDVVPVDGQAWNSDPFRLQVRDQRAYGRGSADMKGFIAAVLAAVPDFAAARLRTPLHIALSYDEEIGCIGVRRLLDVLGGLPTLPRMGIVGEPTLMRVVAAHKGKLAYQVRLRGKAGHSSLPQAGVNAVEYAAELIVFIRQLARQRATEGPFDPLYPAPHTTLHVGAMRGGSALNIIPEYSEFEFEIRHLPEDEPQTLLAAIMDFARQQLLPAMRAVDPDADIVFAERSAYPGLLTAPDAEVVRFAQSLLGDTRPPAKVSFGTEAGLFSQQVGIPTVVLGPGSITQAHQPDEWLALEQLSACDRLLAVLRQRLSEPVP
ncbi:acetylornithine deacetylase [Chromobacterium haemolyticum]|uniref:acetylornithine deacetylase n=1 Tax=Chromobacterium haemolyticum TaxID=394935 RepID=UPI000DF0134A|nr:acetylornithine deacetylase [Chromobacterium haemolyticum]